MFKFDPLTDEELNAPNMLEPAIYKFIVKEAEATVSQKGNSMLKIKLLGTDNLSKNIFIYDYLVNLKSTQYKIKSFCDCIGLKEKYIEGNLLADDCLDKEVFVRVGIQKDPTGKYKDKNYIDEYMPKNEHPALEKALDPFDDSIPF